MTLDVYVGSLTRYFSGDWYSVADRGAWQQDGQPGSSTSVGAPSKDGSSMHLSVLAWRLALQSALGSNLSQPLSWSETSEAPWFSDRMTWEGLGALALWAAYAEQPALQRPLILPEDWDDDAALIRSNAVGFRSRYRQLVRNVELWLPAAFDFSFEAQDVDGRRIVIGSSDMLRQQLAELNAATWRMGDDEMQSLARSGAPGGKVLEDAARHAMAVMMGSVRQAVTHRLPLKLDY